MFLDLFRPLVMAPKRRTVKKRSSDIETFLGEMLIQHGERSVFFVDPCFFSVRSNLLFLRFLFPEYIDEWIEALIAKKTSSVRRLKLFFTV